MKPEAHLPAVCTSCDQGELRLSLTQPRDATGGLEQTSKRRCLIPSSTFTRPRMDTMHPPASPASLSDTTLDSLDEAEGIFFSPHPPQERYYQSKLSRARQPRMFNPRLPSRVRRSSYICSTKSQNCKYIILGRQRD